MNSISQEGNPLKVAFLAYGNAVLTTVLEFGTEFVKKKSTFLAYN